MDRETYLKVVALVGQSLDIDELKQLRSLLQPDDSDPIAEDRAIRGRLTRGVIAAQRARAPERAKMFPNAGRLR